MENKGLLLGAGVGALAGLYLYGKGTKDKDGKVKFPLIGMQLSKLMYIGLWAGLGAVGGKVAQQKGMKPFAAKYGPSMQHFETDAFGQQPLMV